jgi:hypothetical protein
VTPAPRQPLAPLRLGFDRHARAREPEPAEADHEPLGQPLGREGGGLDVDGGRVELGGLDELRGRRRRRRGGLVATAGEPVGARPGRPEAPEHRAVGERCERAQRAQAEPDEQVAERVVGPLGIVEHRDRPRREEPR